jgi:hypothetical protein
VPAYGALVAGGGSLITFLNSFITAFAGIRALLNAKYSTIDYTARSIVAKKFSSPSKPIAALVSSLSTIVVTGTPHGLTTGQTVNIYGITAPVAANGLWVITVVSPTQFSLNGSGVFAIWTGDGFWQVASGKQELQYGDTATVADVAVGGVGGDALPLYVSASVRRLNAGVGRNFRSRLSFSPMSEADSVDGGWVAGTKTAWATALSAFLTFFIDNGSTDVGQSIMSDFVVSPTQALALVSPFTQADSWTKVITSLSLQRNSGSLVRRKPRLTTVIT